ncbi:bcl-2-like protein 1 [Polypterus senegalus]|uniref:bcl-2-like protein 1 n=1 Tax=Polypterus senegalus TaxID=55291 RepID=UPI00196511F8|nr:bcl-2-like protein 1 [Polypterus senegalus]XP_039623806.1 bcl-2-like protein 1 [Polypterus senegalus]XP_039623807.1 bcl-2-like protein 1 [Polypterus senegalus]
MSYSNRELVEDFISYKLSQKNVLSSQSELDVLQVNGTGILNSFPVTPASNGVKAVKEALRGSGDEFELRYRAAFNDLASELHITPVTAYQSFEEVVGELFRDGVNWGRIVALFSFGGALCVECVEKEMVPLVRHIADWMTTYLDNNLDPWILSNGGWDTFVRIYGRHASAEYFKKWLVVGVTVTAGLVLASFIAHTHL